MARALSLVRNWNLYVTCRETDERERVFLYKIILFSLRMCRDITTARLLLTLVQLLVGVMHIKPTNAIVEAENCWNESQECLIHATLHRMDEPPHSTGLTMEIDCREAKAEMPTMYGNNSAPAFLLRRLEHAASLLLDGCHTPLDVHTYGMEYMPNCDTVPQVFMEHFHGDTLLPFNCPSAMAVETLRYSNNKLATIAANTFANLPQLRELYFAHNSLRHIASNAFDTLRVVERIHIVNEPSLALKDGILFERTGVADLQLVQLKYITAELFVHLPETLRQIVVARTTFANDALIVSNPQLLRNISINGCTLKTFVLRESEQTMSVKYINLSANALSEFRVEFLSASGAPNQNNKNNNSIASVETLDLSANELTQLPLSWLHGLSKLRYLLLRDNCLVALALPQLFVAIPLVVLLDLRGNQLTTLADAALVANALSWAQVHIKIDRNPWSCLWLLEFAHTHPEKFRIFQYEKFISQINVNGLQCVPAEVSTQPAHITESATYTSVNTMAPLNEVTTSRNAINASTYKLIYGGPWDYKRSQRAEGLVIVFMLPVGVALLFILLYMWIKCQKVFHLSYYRSFTWSQSIIGRRFASSAERFDIVRQLPPLPGALNVNNNNHHNNNDDYETPLNGIDSVCNCNNIGDTPTYTNEKCRKLHHITYEELPCERPYKIYEEIIGDGDATDTETYAQPFYDHLSFTQPTRSDSD